MNNCALSDIAAVLKSRQSFVVMSHARPDGDAYGCTLAMALCLRQLGKVNRVTISRLGTLWGHHGDVCAKRFHD